MDDERDIDRKLAEFDEKVTPLYLLKLELAQKMRLHPAPQDQSRARCACLVAAEGTKKA